MILVGIGGNLESPQFGPPRDILAAALPALEEESIRIVARSGWYRTEPVPLSDQPWFINAVLSVSTELGPADLLERLHSVETRFGRERSEPDAARVLDLDLLDYRGQVRHTQSLILPHPRLHRRRFVLEPIAAIAPGWRHPISGLSAAQLLARLPPGQEIERLIC